MKDAGSSHLKTTYAVMLQSLSAFVLESGVSRNDVITALAEVQSIVANGKALSRRAPNYGGLTERVMGAYAQWWTDPDYLENGTPAALPIRGSAPSIESLLHGHVSAHELDAAIELMKGSPGVSKERKERLRATSAAFLNPPYHSSSLDRVARVFSGWLATLRLNNRVANRSDGMFEQTLVTTAIPVSYVPVLKRNVREQLSQSLQSLYTPMLKAERRGGPRIKGEIGVQVFMYELP